MKQNQMTKLFSPSWWASTLMGIILIIILLVVSCNTARSQERAVLVSSEKIKMSTLFYVCVETKEGKRYSFKWNSHCFRCDTVNISTYWTVIQTKRKVFIKPEL